jgi:hypothetical protein
MSFVNFCCADCLFLLEVHSTRTWWRLQSVSHWIRWIFSSLSLSLPPFFCIYFIYSCVMCPYWGTCVVFEFLCFRTIALVLNFSVAVQVQGIFGFSGEDHIGKISFPPVQVSFGLLSTDVIWQVCTCLWWWEFMLLDLHKTPYFDNCFLSVFWNEWGIQGSDPINFILCWCRQFHHFPVHSHTFSREKTTSVA